METVEDTLVLDKTTNEPDAQGKGLDSRAYQIEMFEQSMRENTIVAMDTGSGKTQIAKLRIEAELERSPEKLIWFCAPSVVLAQQQHAFLSSQLPASHIRLITGLDNVEFWSTQDVWDAVLDQIDLVISTPQVLLDAMSHGFVTLQQMSLLVFDEAHHCIAGGPMARIMQLFYLPAKMNGKMVSVPHVLGLTASPITNKPSMLRELEQNMNAVCKTPILQVEDYKKYVHIPILEKIEFDPSQAEVPQVVEALDKIVTHLSFHEDPTVAWLQSIENRSVALEQKLNKILISRRTPAMKQMGSFLNHATHINNNIGSWSADKYIRQCARRLHEAVDLHEDLFPQLSNHEQRYIDLKLQSVVTSVHTIESQMPEGFLIAPKAQALIDYLLQQYHPGITVIIFVKRRSVASALTHLFKACSQMENYNAFSFVGSTVPAHRTLVDLADMQAQQEAFADFQTGKRNVCIATQVMEEGVDIQATNLVIRFDEPENFRSFIQSRGRARRPNSKFVVMYESADLNTLVKVRRWKDLETVMKEQYSDLTRHMLEQEAIELEYEKGDESYHVESTGAVLNYDNAQQHLEHFCATLPWESSSEPARPTTLVSGFPGVKTARVILPVSVPLALQTTNSLHTWRTEKMAKKDAAFQTYKSLHTAKLINDNLLPYPRVRKSNPRLEGRDTFYDVHEALDSWRTLADMSKKSTHLYSHRIRVTGDDFALPDMILLISIRLDHQMAFTLHDVVSGSILVEIFPINEISDVEPDLASRVTHYLFNIILGRRLKAMDASNQLPYYLVPDVMYSELANWFGRVQITIPLSDLQFNDSLERQVYLIKYERQNVLYKWSLPRESDQVRNFDPDASITAERLSKQLTFVRQPQAEHQAVRDIRTLKVQDCQIQGLSAAYGTFMLLMPSISYMLAVGIRGQLAIQDGPLAPVEFTNSQLVKTALTSSSALADQNFETLEFLGDSLLKFYATVQVFFSYLDLTEGGLTSKYSAIASNTRLQKATRALGLDAYITTDTFSGSKWTLAISNEELKTRKMSSKTLADVVEALTAAAYLDPKNGPTKDEMPLSALKCLLPSIHWKLPSVHIQEYHKQASLPNINIARLEPVESMLGYTFNNKSLLLEALTRTSIRVGLQSYQRLEFLGDAILDRIVSMALYNSSFNQDPGQLSEHRTALVNRWILNYLAMEAHYTTFINDISSTTASGPPTVTQIPKTTRLIDHIRKPGDRAGTNQRNKAETTFVAARDEITTVFTTGNTFPWIALHSIDAPKSYSDIIESLIAAVFIDSNGSLVTCELMLEKLGLLPILRRLANDLAIEVRQPYVILKLMHPSITIEEKVSGRIKDDSHTWRCKIYHDEVVVGESVSTVSQKHAEALASTMALEGFAKKKRSFDAMDVE